MDNTAIIISFLIVALSSGCAFLIARCIYRGRLCIAERKEPPSRDGFSLSNRETRQIEISKNELELIFDSIPEQICILDSTFTVVRANRSFSEFAQKPIRELIGQKCHKIRRQMDAPCEECPAKMTFEQGLSIFRKSFPCTSGDTVKHFEVSVFPVFDENRRVVHVIESARDITDEKLVTEQMIVSEKLASLGKMTSGIAHEMTNPLSGISGNASNLLSMPQKYGLNEKGVSRVAMILNAATHATAIMDDLLHLSKKPDPASVAVNLNSLLMKTVSAVHIEDAGDIERIFNMDDTLPKFNCDPAKLQQAFVHIVTNGLLAILDRKKNRVNENLFRGLLVISTYRTDDRICITIADNGIGIPETIKNRIFDPFFSTRPAGQGSGLGLSVSNKIIAEYGGRIEVDRINDMTRFSIVLPIRTTEPE